MYRPPLPAEARLSDAGRGMRRIRTSKPNVSWLQGPGPCDLWTWREDSGVILEQELTFFGRTVVLKNHQLVTGLCHEGAGGYVGRMGVLHFDSKVDVDTLKAAAIVLEHIAQEARADGVDHLAAAIRDALAPAA
jgi:hypothetical protein